MSKVDKQIALIADQYIPFVKNEAIPSIAQQHNISGVMPWVKGMQFSADFAEVIMDRGRSSNFRRHYQLIFRPAGNEKISDFC